MKKMAYGCLVGMMALAQGCIFPGDVIGGGGGGGGTEEEQNCATVFAPVCHTTTGTEYPNRCVAEVEGGIAADDVALVDGRCQDIDGLRCSEDSHCEAGYECVFEGDTDAPVIIDGEEERQDESLQGNEETGVCRLIPCIIDEGGLPEPQPIH